MERQRPLGQPQHFEHPVGVGEVADEPANEAGAFLHQAGHAEDIFFECPGRVLLNINHGEGVPAEEVPVANALDIAQRRFGPRRRARNK